MHTAAVSADGHPTQSIEALSVPTLCPTLPKLHTHS